MKIEWQNRGTDMQVATVGEFSLVVVPCVVQGLPKWQGSVNCSGRPGPCAYRDDLGSAKSWAETKLAALVAPFVEAARAEAALAEREACAALALDRAERWHHLMPGTPRNEAQAVAFAIRARTTPATLSTDTLAAIAEARGLRVVTAERVAELEAAAKTEREACAQIAHERAEMARLPEGWAVGCSEALAIESAIRARGARGTTYATASLTSEDRKDQR